MNGPAATASARVMVVSGSASVAIASQDIGSAAAAAVVEDDPPVPHAAAAASPTATAVYPSIEISRVIFWFSGN